MAILTAAQTERVARWLGDGTLAAAFPAGLAVLVDDDGWARSRGLDGKQGVVDGVSAEGRVKVLIDGLCWGLDPHELAPVPTAPTAQDDAGTLPLYERFLTIMGRYSTYRAAIGKLAGGPIDGDQRQEFGEIKADARELVKAIKASTDTEGTYGLERALDRARFVTVQAMSREWACVECECLFDCNEAEGDEIGVCPECNSGDVEPRMFFNHPLALSRQG